MSCLIARTVALNLHGRYFLLHISKKEFICFFVKMKIEMSVKGRMYVYIIFSVKWTDGMFCFMIRKLHH